MKYRFLLFLAGVLLTLTSCSKYAYVTLNYPTPPQVSLPEEINSIALINRTIPEKESEKGRTIEAVTSGEIAGDDIKAADESIRAVYENMDGLYGMRIVIPEENRLYGTGTGKTPALLNWDEVANHCKTEEVDALLVLESFDSNSDLMLTAATESVNALISGRLPDPTAPRQINMDVNCYWRLYYPANNSLVDQYQHTTHMTFSSHDAVLQFDMLEKSAYAAGEEFVFRYLPGHYKVKRKLYSKAKGPGKHKFKTGFRQSEVAKWEAAIESWKEFLKVAKPKHAGRASLNIAVGYEVLGNTEEALNWAQRSYEDYGNELARDYAKILLKRKTLE